MSQQARRWLVLAAGVIGFAGTLVMIEVMLSRHNWRIDLTPERRFTLSEHARRLLADIDQDVEVMAFVRSDEQRNRDIEDLLTRVHNASPHVRYSVIDINRSPAVARQYGIDGYGRLLVKTANHRQIITGAREDLLMAALLQATRPSRPILYFLTGHGEPEVDGTDRQHGYASARMALEQEFYQVRSLSLLDETDVPADAAAVVLAAPQRDLLPGELRQLGAYAARGGGLLVLLGAGEEPGLEQLLEAYGVQLPPGVVVDPANRLFAGDALTVPVPGLSPKHPVSAATHAVPLFSGARAVGFAATDPQTKGVEILHTAASSWRTADAELVRGGTAHLARGRDQPGPIPVGVSLLIGPGAAAQAASMPGRVIILGNGSFAENGFIDYLGNRDLLVNAVNWVAGEQALIGERPAQRPGGVNQFFVSARQGILALVLSAVLEPGIVLVLAAIVLWRHRRDSK